MLRRILWRLRLRWPTRRSLTRKERKRMNEIMADLASGKIKKWTLATPEEQAGTCAGD